MAKKPSKLKNLLVAHEGNGYHPHLFRRTAVASLVLAVVVLEGAYLFDTQVAQNRQGFLASVLPAALLDLTNADRTANGVAPLKEDPSLDRAAQLKANDMAAKGYFAHVSPDGKTPWYWLDQVGYQYTYAGENLAINFNDSSAVETAWMNSPTHRANIVKPQYTRVGYAVAEGMYQGKETTFVVQEFATQPSDETVTSEPKQQNPLAKAITKAVAVVTPAKAEQPEKVAPTAATSSGQSMVLATQEVPSASPDSWFSGFVKLIAASPLAVLMYILGALITLMTALLAFALRSHARVRYMEVLGGGLMVIIFALSVLVYDATHALSPMVSGQAAAITALSS